MADSQLRPNEPDLAAFVDALFRYADENTYVSWRAFRDDTKDAPPVFIESSIVTNELSHLVEAAVFYAARAADNPGKAVFCPPIATFANARRARELDLANGLALSVECDTYPVQAKLMLERILGPATVVVASGGLWVDAEEVVHEKLHLHWRLSEPTSEQADHAKLKRARILATAIVGGDATNVPAVHPIRWPGSWHRKGEPRLARIVELRKKEEINLAGALELLESAASTVPIRGRIHRDVGEILEGDSGSTSALVAELISGASIHAPLVALAYRYLKGGMADAQAVLTLRGLMDAIPEPARNRSDQPDRWAGHYRDIPRTVRTAREKLQLQTPASAPGADVGDFVTSIGTPAIIAARIPEAPAEIPPHLLSPPGVLGDVARYGIESAVRPVPAFAAQAALALGSVVCARRYMTSNRNYASLYFMNVAKSGTGKEEAKTTIERILKAAGVARLINGSSYSSGNAVFSALLKKPQHITVIDEFGKYLEAASLARDSFRSEVLTQLMEAFGRVHADMLTPQFSTMTLSAGAASGHEPRAITRPSITLLAMTTPSTFYESLRSSRIVDGFLNRFLIAEHQGPRLPMSEWRDVPVPPRVESWVKQLLTPRGNLDLGMTPEHIGDPIIVELTERSREHSRLFESEMYQLADRLESRGLGDMPIRAREVALRLSLILALSDTPDTPMVTVELFDWAADYVRFYLMQTVRALQERVSDSATERTRNTILAAIRAAGGQGLTNRDLHRGKAFIGIPKRERHDAIEGLLAAELIAWADLPIGDKGGRPRRALVAVGEDQAGEESNSALQIVPLDRAS